jgi:phospholipid/cholesterol/gamma-HCH transport system ATP-binding protein
MEKTVLSLIDVAKAPEKPGLGCIDGLRLNLAPGETLSVLGMNRWERRTVLDLIMALAVPDKGEVRFLGENLAGLREGRLERIRGRIGVVTDPPVFLNNVRIRENLRLPLRYHSNLTGAEIDAKLAPLLESLDLRGFADVIPSNFEHSFLYAAALARALSVDPDLLLIERPEEGLGKAGRTKLEEICRKYAQDRGGTVLVFGTSPRLAGTLCRRVGLFESGRISAVEDSEAFRRSGRYLETQWKDTD